MNKSLMKRLLLRRFSFLSLVSATLLFACHSPLLPDEEDDPWNPGTGEEEERTDTVSVDTVPIVHTGSDGDPSMNRNKNARPRPRVFVIFECLILLSLLDEVDCCRQVVAVPVLPDAAG